MTTLRPYLKHPRAASNQPWTAPALCAAYQWPTNAPGGGILAIVELGGGWIQSDLDAFFASIGQPVPSVVDVSVDGTKNTPTDGNDSPDYEVALDIEVAAAAYYVATGKVATVKVYWAKDIASAVTMAANDGCDVCSISWGADETGWGPADAQAMDAAAAAAVAKGMVTFAASGDNDADDGGGATGVDCPASCPHVVGCGGTSKPQGAPETVWNNDPNPSDPTGEGTGGGYSIYFPSPSWQVGAPTPPTGLGRMVPDLAANADPNTGYQIYCHGSALTIGGTSAVAPLYAGLFAAFGKKLGFVTPKLWTNKAAFTDITSGGNGVYHAATGPDPCTGLGAPIGTAIAALFAASSQPAPTPPVPSPTAPPTLAQALAAVTAAIQAGAPLEDKGQAIASVTGALTPLWPA